MVKTNTIFELEVIVNDSTPFIRFVQFFEGPAHTDSRWRTPDFIEYIDYDYCSLFFFYRETV